jgi:hypothetical protein
MFAHAQRSGGQSHAVERRVCHRLRVFIGLRAYLYHGHQQNRADDKKLTIKI